jgi:choline dehydrogenase
MVSGIGDQAELQRLGIPLVQHLPGVGQNFQDHLGIGSVWEYQQPLAPRNNGGEATFFWKSNSNLDTPDLQACLVEAPLCSAETAAKFNPPHACWTLFGGDLKAAVACVELCREIGNSAALRPFTKREVMPGALKGRELEDFIRDAAETYHHQTCTAKMGLDSMSVVDAKLKVHGIESLRSRRVDHAAGGDRQYHGSLCRHR